MLDVKGVNGTGTMDITMTLPLAVTVQIDSGINGVVKSVDTEDHTGAEVVYDDCVIVELGHRKLDENGTTILALPLAGPTTVLED